MSRSRMFDIDGEYGQIFNRPCKVQETYRSYQLLNLIHGNILNDMLTCHMFPTQRSLLTIRPLRAHIHCDTYRVFFVMFSK